MKDFFTYFKITGNYISWITRNTKPWPKEEGLIEYLGMDISEFEKKFKYLKSDSTDYINFYRERPINLDFLADYESGIVHDYLPDGVDLKKAIDAYRELIEVVKILEEKE